MIHKTSLLLFVNVILFFQVHEGLTQDLFNKQSTKAYAEYLLVKKDYKKAATEYERLSFIDSLNIQQYKSNLLLCYYHLSNLEAIQSLKIDKFDSLNSQLVFLTYLRLNQLKTSKALLDSSKYTFSLNTKKLNQGLVFLLNQEFDKANTIISEIPLEGNFENTLKRVGPVVSQLANYQAKKPLLAMGLSAVIPGLGRVYTKDYADAILNFIFISVTAFQSYRGFTDPNIREWQGWLYGGLSASFYLGNIYGSHLAAKRYNQTYYKKELEKARYHIFSTN